MLHGVWHGVAAAHRELHRDGGVEQREVAAGEADLVRVRVRVRVRARVRVRV